MSYAAASHVRTSATLVSAPELPDPVLDSGGNWCEPFAWYDRSTSSWRTWQLSLVEGWELFLETWPRAGMTRNGIAYQRKPLALPMRGIGGGASPALKAVLPTVGKNEFKGSSRKRFVGSKNFRGAKMSEGLRICETDPIYLSPSFAELVMGYPIGWTELELAETP